MENLQSSWQSLWKKKNPKNRKKSVRWFESNDTKKTHKVVSTFHYNPHC